MSNERIDHAKEAGDALYWLENAGDNIVRERGPMEVAMAQVHATLALVEQMRIANLIALAESGRTTVNGARQALSAIYDGTVEGGTARMSLRPDIAAALGIEGWSDE